MRNLNRKDAKTQRKCGRNGIFLSVFLVSWWLSVFLFSLGVVTAQERGLGLAGFADGRVTLYGEQAASVGDEYLDMLDMVWSPDGEWLVYAPLMPPGYWHEVWVTNGSTPVSIDRLLYPFRFDFDDQGRLIYAVEDIYDEGEAVRVKVMRVALGTSLTKEEITTISVSEGCGGGSPLPSEHQYWRETAPGGNPLVLKLTRYGLIYSHHCSGVGLSVKNLDTGAVTVIDDRLARVVVSPDEGEALGVRIDAATGAKSLVRVDLATLTLTPLATLAEPEQIIWGREGDIFYSSSTQAGDITVSDAEQARIDAVLGYQLAEIPQNTVTIHRLNLDSREDTVIYEADAYRIGRMVLAQDGESLIFSQIPNLDAWIKAMVDGEFTADQTLRDALDYVPVSVFQIQLADGAVSEIGAGISLVAVSSQWSVFRIKQGDCTTSKVRIPDSNQGFRF